MRTAACCLAFLALAFLGLWAASGTSVGHATTGRAVGGTDRARMVPPAGARVSDYSGFGYRLELRGDEVTIEVDAAPLHSTARFVPPGSWRDPSAGAPDDEIARLARGLALGAATQYEAGSRILGWVAGHLRYDFDRSQPQTARAVLARRSGYCTGVARATVALFAAAGIEAREVPGYVAGEGYHRWIEVRLADRGWVMSDPLRSHHYVPASYLRLASDELWTDEGVEGLLLERDDAIVPVDLYPAAAGVTARSNDGRRLAGALRVEVLSEAEGTAVLECPTVRYRHALVDGATTFVGLRPGRCDLRLLLPGAEVERRINVPDHRLVHLRLGPFSAKGALHRARVGEPGPFGNFKEN